MSVLMYSRIETGYARVYYTEQIEGKKTIHYCFQECSKGEFCLYRCSRDGEPSHVVPYQELIGRMPMPTGKDPFTNLFLDWVHRELKELQLIALE